MTALAVVIPTKNEEHYLPVLLDALARQTRKADEIVVADAGSTDATGTIARDHGVRVIEGGSPAVGRNAGASATRGDVIIFFDADAIINERFLEHAVDEFTRRNLDLATADIVVHEGRFSDRLSFRLYNTYVRLWGRHHPHPIGTFMIVRRVMHAHINGFNAAVTFAEDHDYGLRVRSAGGTFGVLNEVQVGITPRRQKKIGRLRFLLVNILAEPYIMLFGSIRSPWFARYYERPKS